MRRLYAIFAFTTLLLLLCSTPAAAMDRVQGWCEDGGVAVTIPGTQGSGTQRFQQTYRSCTITVYDAGTVNLSTLYSDNANPPTALANPFTANGNNGRWFFYAINGRYDIRFSAGGIATPFTLGDFNLNGNYGPTGVTANVAIGSGALATVTTGFENIAIGQAALDSCTTCYTNIAIGHDALTAQTVNGVNNANNGTNNIAIGHNAMVAAINNRFNIAIGNSALSTIGASNRHNIAIGWAAGQLMTPTTEASANGTSNVFVGHTAGQYCTTCSSNAAFGTEAMAYPTNQDYNSTGTNNTAIGTKAFQHAGTGAQNAAIGAESMAQLRVATGNVSVGYRAMLGQLLAGDPLNTSGVTENVAVGWEALLSLTTGSLNVAVGSEAGAGVYTGSNNTFIGYNAGRNVGTASAANVFIGFRAGRDETGSNRLYIANSEDTTPLIYGEFDNSIVYINSDTVHLRTAGGATREVFNATSVALNTTNLDRDFSYETVSNSDAFVYDAAAFGNVGAGGIGSRSVTDNFWLIAPPIITTTNNTAFSVLGVGSAATITLTGTAPNVDAIRVPAIALSGIATVASSIRIVGAPTGGTVTTRRALDITAGHAFFGATVSVATFTGATGTHICYDATAAEANTFATCTSLEEYKDSLKMVSVNATSIINRLKTISFRFKPSSDRVKLEDQPFQYGLGAHQVYSIDPKLSTFYDGKLNGVNFDGVTALLVKSSQEMDTRVRRLESTVRSQAMEIQSLKRASAVAVK